jgi:micrococcal nuclease
VSKTRHPQGAPHAVPLHARAVNKDNSDLSDIIVFTKPEINKLHLIIPLLLLILFHPSYVISANSDEAVTADCEFQKVSKVIDGDTFRLHDGSTVRLIGIDTPETVDPRKNVQWFGREASRKLREWVKGETVCLKRGGNDDIDKYDRLLRYVWINNGEFFVNAELIKQGYAFAYTRFPFRYKDEFRDYEKEAREKNLGLWDEKKLSIWQEKVEKNIAIAKTCRDADTICPEDALSHIGEKKTVRFFVKKSFDSGKAIFLNSENDFKVTHNFTAVIFSRNRGRFPDSPDDHYWGQTVDVTGVIKEYKGRAEIILKKVHQIRVVLPQTYTDFEHR